MYWIYQALNRTGEEITGSFEGAKGDMLAFLSEHQWELINMRVDYAHSFKQALSYKGLSSEVLARFFNDFYNMFTTGMTVNEIISALRETAVHKGLREILIRTETMLAQGMGLGEAVGQERSMPWIVHSTLYAGERSGKLKETVAVLGNYFKRRGDIKNKISSAVIYPVMVFILLVAVMLFVSLQVVPKLQVLLPPEAMEYPATRCVLFLSAVFQKMWGILLAIIIVGGFTGYHYCKERRVEMEAILYQVPLLGDMLKESAFSFYFLNLSVLLKSGVPLIKALGELEGCMANALSHRFLACRDYMLGGSSFWQAIASDSFFPSVIVHTLRRGEEVAKIGDYCENLTAYFHQRVQVKVDGMVHLIQPFLLGIGGLFLVLIAFAFLIPIYGSLTKIAGG
jgi:type IV pilus assembly protein PilC